MKAKKCFFDFLLIENLFLFSFIIRFINKLHLSDKIPLKSDEGQNLLLNSSHCVNYELLNNYFQKQDKFNYCGVASATMILNALSTPAQTPSKFDNSSTLTQNTVFKNKIQPKIFGKIFFLGMTLEQLEQLFKAYSLNTKIYYVDKFLNLERFKNLGKLSLNQADTFIVINYGRYWGLSGHISPLGAYNLKTERFLIIDVAQENSSVWVKAETLYSAMATSDPMSCGKSRGFIVVSKNS